VHVKQVGAWLYFLFHQYRRRLVNDILLHVVTHTVSPPLLPKNAHTFVA
jgi:hypothetical protein